MVALDAFLQPRRMFFEQRLARRQRGIAAFAQIGSIRPANSPSELQH